MNIRSTLSDFLPLALKNPSRELAKKLLSGAAGTEARGVIDPKTCDVLIWIASEATHKQVTKSMNLGIIDRKALFRYTSADQIDMTIVWS